MPNIIQSYPKSGLTWTETRMITYLEMIGHFIKKTSDLDKYCIRDHLTRYSFYANRKVTFNPSIVDSFEEHPQLFVILRDAKQILNAIYKRESTSTLDTSSSAPFPADESDEPFRADDFPLNIDEFIRSEYGIKRICYFLNEIAIIEQKRIINKPIYIHYNDMFKIQSVQIIPEMLGFNHRLTEKEQEYIFDNTKINNVKNDNHWFKKEMIKRRHIQVGDINAYMNLFSTNNLNFIQDYLRKHCNLEEYNKTYL